MGEVSGAINSHRAGTDPIAYLRTNGHPIVEGRVFDTVATHRLSFLGSPGAATANHELPLTLPATDLDPRKIDQGGDVAGDSRVVLTAEQSQGGWLESEEAYIHGPSGLTCAKSELAFGALSGDTLTIYPMPLKNVIVFTDDGSDVGCHYEYPEAGIYFTVYASRWPGVSLEDHFASALQDIAENLTLDAESPIIITSPGEDDEEAEADQPDYLSTIEGETLGAAFLLEPMDQGIVYKTALWLNKTGDWHVKGRGTFFNGTVKNPVQLPFTEISLSSSYADRLEEIDRHINTVGEAGVIQVSY